MAQLQILIDPTGNVVGVKSVPTPPLADTFNTVTAAYSYGVSAGTAREASDKSFALLVEQSTKLTDAEKVQIRTLIRARPVGDTLVITPAPGPAVISPALTDPANAGQVLIPQFKDP